jgi:hypothetical protein
VLVRDLGQHGGQGGRISMNVGENGDPPCWSFEAPKR